MRFRFIFALFFYCLTLFSLTVYSYSQIDLNLTLSSDPYYQFFQNNLIQLGYFNRPLSSGIFLAILASLFIFYGGFLYWGKKISFRQLKWLVILTSGILFLSYPAFSHDIFNYMFDARILTKYHANPYIHTALDYPDDLWTRFMHWTHRTYPYGPVWLAVSALFSLLGMGKFVLSLLNYKIMFLLFHLGNIYLIHKILSKTKTKNEITGLIFFALNPLILIESLTSPHNESLMLFFLLLSLYYLLVGTNIFISFLSIIASAGVKFITLIVAPIIFARVNLFKKVKTGRLLNWIFLLLVPALILEIAKREPYPWYLVLFIGVGALITRNRFLAVVLIGASLGTELRYLTFLYTGEYNDATEYWQNVLMFIPLGLSFIYMISLKLLKK